MINEWINTATGKKCKTGGRYPSDLSPYWIADVPAHRFVKVGYSFYEHKSVWADDANEQIKKFLEE